MFRAVDGVYCGPIKEFIEQPAEGILYDLNRDKVTTLSMRNKFPERWVNDYAVAVTIVALKARIEELEVENKRLREACGTGG
jgi:hypothetical protein